jgi:orotate phosphoribosyltransferase
VTNSRTSNAASSNAAPSNAALTADFIRFMLDSGVLKLGSFKTKSGRLSPYFLDAGRYGRGAQLARLGAFYADRLLDALGDGFDVLFGPAYKGIPLVVATAMALSERGRDVGFCFNRKEAKLHGEGGVLVGHTLRDGDRVVIVEDVTTAGTSIRETVPILRAAAKVDLRALIVSVDRQERGQSEQSALAEVGAEFGLTTFSIVNIDQIVDYLRNNAVNGQQLITPELDAAIADYRRAYGVR